MFWNTPVLSPEFQHDAYQLMTREDWKTHTSKSTEWLMLQNLLKYSLWGAVKWDTRSKICNFHSSDACYVENEILNFLT